LFHRAALWPGLVLACGIASFAVFSAFIPEHAHSVGLAGAAGLFLVYSAISLSLRLFGATLPERSRAVFLLCDEPGSGER